MISGFIQGFMSYFGAFGFIRQHGLSRYFLLSGLISVVIGTILAIVIYGFSDDLGGFLTSLYPWDWKRDAINSVLDVASGLVLAIFGFLLFKYILLIIISPFMGPLSAKVEEIVIGRTEQGKFSIKALSYEMVRGARIALRNISRELFFTIILLMIGLVPLLTIFTTSLIFLVQSYYAGFANFDYFLERRTNVAQSVAYNRAHRGMVLGNGAAFMLLLLIPVLGLFLAPVLGTVSATRMALQQKDLPDYIE